MQRDRGSLWIGLLVAVLVAVLVAGFLGLFCVGCGGGSETAVLATTTTAGEAIDPGDASVITGSTTNVSTTLSNLIDSGGASSPTTQGTGPTSTQPGGTTEGSIATTANSTGTAARSTSTSAKDTTTTAKATTTTAKVVALRVTGPSGTKELSMAEIKAMSATSGYGGWKNVLDNITGPRPYKGVSLKTLMNLVGGGSSVTVVASDGYEQTLTAGELNGDVNLYNPSNGAPISSISGSITAMVAYELNGGSLSKEEGGPLRITFVSPANDQVTDSKLWVKFVSSIKVK